MIKQATMAAISAVALALSACGETSQSGGNAQSGGESNSAATFAIGKTGTAKGVEYVLTKVEQRTQIGPAGIGPKAEPNETFVVAHYTIKNTSSSPLPALERPGVGLVDGSGQTFALDDLASGMASDMTGLYEDLNPGVSAKTAAAWKVDKKAFDQATWKFVVQSDPTLTFALK